MLTMYKDDLSFAVQEFNQEPRSNHILIDKADHTISQLKNLLDDSGEPYEVSVFDEDGIGYGFTTETFFLDDVLDSGNAYEIIYGLRNSVGDIELLHAKLDYLATMVDVDIDEV